MKSPSRLRMSAPPDEADGQVGRGRGEPSDRRPLEFELARVSGQDMVSPISPGQAFDLCHWEVATRLCFWCFGT